MFRTAIKQSFKICSRSSFSRQFIERNVIIKKQIGEFRSLSSAVDGKGLGPLSDVRILDFTRVLAGPYCTMILGDLGAEILKIERPGTGDDTRQWGPPFVGKESCYFFSINRNKKSITVNLQKDEGKEIIKKLIAHCDVLVENFIPGKMDELGLGYEDLKALRSDLIYCSISGFGQDGPYAKRSGYDVIAAGMGGLLNVTGSLNGDPCRVGVAVTDLATGLYAHGAILAAIVERKKSGSGQRIDCNLLSTQVACMVNMISNYINAGAEGHRWGTGHESLVPYQAFPTSDGYILIGAGTDKMFKTLCEHLGCPSLAEDERFKNNSTRVKYRNDLISLLSDKTKHSTTEEWLEVLKNSGLPNGPINTFEQVVANPQVQHNKLVQTLSHPEIGEVKVIGPPVKYSNIENYCRLPPPLLGEHTEEILTNFLNYNKDQFKKLKEDRIL